MSTFRVQLIANILVLNDYLKFEVEWSNSITSVSESTLYTRFKVASELSGSDSGKSQALELSKY
jgi:hypothetical protein